MSQRLLRVLRFTKVAVVKPRGLRTNQIVGSRVRISLEIVCMCMCVCMYVYTYVCIYVCMYVYMYVCNVRNECMHAFMCMYVHMYVCMVVVLRCCLAKG
jgi:hypothetical protein